jgi:hypothetical protein
MVDVALLYRQHLTDADHRLLRRVHGAGAFQPEALADPRVEAAVFTDGSPEAPFVATSPFLTFAVAVHRTAVRLDHASYVEEPWSARQRIPVFDVVRLRELLADPARCFFLIELLASYTHVSSGVTWERTRRGWRRRRFSELDLVGLAGLLDVVDPAERAGVYRRLGDLTLFLTGVFPDHAVTLELGGVAVGRLLRSSGVRREIDTHMNGREFLEFLGPRFYRRAAELVRAHGDPMTSGLDVVNQIGERFGEARRILNTVTDQYLFPMRPHWFGAG